MSCTMRRAPNGGGKGGGTLSLFTLLLYSLYLGKVALAALEAGRSTVCVVDGEEKLAQVYKEVSDLDNTDK